MRAVCQSYLALNTRIRSERTKEHYWRSIRQFSEHLGRPATIDDLTDDNVARWQVAILEAGYSPATANQRVKQIRALWEWAARRGMIDRFPSFRPVREPEQLPVAWWPHELRAIFEACERVDGWVGQHRACVWMSALHHWLYDTAERTEATLALRRDWVDLTSRTAKIPADVRKGGYKAMVYRLRPVTCQFFARMFTVETDTGLVFDHHWRQTQSFYRRYRQLIESAGLPYERGKSGPQKMRRTVFTMIEIGGGDATQFARHSSRTVTEAYIDQSITLALRAGGWPPDEAPVETPTGKSRSRLRRWLAG